MYRMGMVIFASLLLVLCSFVGVGRAAVEETMESLFEFSDRNGGELCAEFYTATFRGDTLVAKVQHATLCFPQGWSMLRQNDKDENRMGAAVEKFLRIMNIVPEKIYWLTFEQNPEKMVTVSLVNSKKELYAKSTATTFTDAFEGIVAGIEQQQQEEEKDSGSPKLKM